MTVNFQGAVRVSEDCMADQPVTCPTLLAICMLITETQGDEAAILQNFIRINLLKYMSKAHAVLPQRAEAILAGFGIVQAESIFTDRVKAGVGKKPRKGPVVTVLVVEGLK